MKGVLYVFYFLVQIVDNQFIVFLFGYLMATLRLPNGYVAATKWLRYGYEMTTRFFWFFWRPAADGCRYNQEGRDCNCFVHFDKGIRV